MGGGGSYYDRDTTGSRLTSSRGYSDTAERAFAKKRANAAVLPKDRRLRSDCKSPVVYAFDETGSMGDLPKIIYDKMPMIAGELARQEYLVEPLISVAAIGDVLSDADPVQIADFSEIRKLDEWLERLYLEGNGGGQASESYEFMVYFYARLYDMTGAETPIFLFTGDEGFREKLYGAELRQHFGGEHSDVGTAVVLAELQKKFKGNVFLLHKRYGDASLNRTITAQWVAALGLKNVIQLSEDKAVGDTTLGILAIASGARTLDEYTEDMKTRPLDLGGEKFAPQSAGRINDVRESLAEFAASRTKRTPSAMGGKKPRPKIVPKEGDKTTGKKSWQL